MGLYDVGAGTDEPGALRLQAGMLERRGDKAGAVRLRRQADVYEGKAAYLPRTKARLAQQERTRRGSVPAGVWAAGLAVVGLGVVLGSRKGS